MGQKKSNTQKNITLRFRVSRELATLIKARADYFFDGNMSQFFRHAAENFRKPQDERKKNKR